MFKKVTQSIANQMDPTGDLVPVHSILDHEHFRPFCLVKRKRKTLFHPSPYYKRTWYRLHDMLLPGKDTKSTESLFPNGGGQESRQFRVTVSTSDRVDGNLSLCVESVSAEVRGAASLSKGWSIKLEKNHIPLPELEALKSERKINVNHAFIQQLKKARHNLYVVHETVEASEEAHYEESTTAEGGFAAQFHAKLGAKGARENTQSITIPKGCTLAFRPIKLVIEDGSWDLEYFPEDTRSLLISDGVSEGKLGELKREVKENCEILFKLSSDLFIIFLNAIKAVMRDRNLFQELTEKMEAVLDEPDSCELKTESPDLRDLLSSLRHSPRHLLLKLAAAITYTLDALDELTEDQLLLLLESLEEKIVSQQLKLVESLLKPYTEDREGRFSVNTNLLSFSREKEQKLTVAMVEMSGVKLQEDGSAVCTEEDFSAIAALYVSLYILSLLSNSD
ncbi:PREDICTED: gasdermin-A [Nipponia nippon]|uniref:gasdermin-A n=1 Tax=Nipponia nippon TaxID=128390 RepID=UPI000510DDBB|nr:PREDICTED: gasdermin-A [Nipponia nippon]